MNTDVLDHHDHRRPDQLLSVIGRISWR